MANRVAHELRQEAPLLVKDENSEKENQVKLMYEGVTMERDASGEASYAILRGMDKRYNYTLVNGVKIPSPDDKNRYQEIPQDPSQHHRSYVQQNPDWHTTSPSKNM